MADQQVPGERVELSRAFARGILSPTIHGQNATPRRENRPQPYINVGQQRAQRLRESATIPKRGRAVVPRETCVARFLADLAARIAGGVS